MAYEVIFYDHGSNGNGSARNLQNKQSLEKVMSDSGLEVVLRQVNCMKDIPTSTNPKSGVQKGFANLMLEDNLAYAIIINGLSDNFQEALNAAKVGCDLHSTPYNRIIVIGGNVAHDGYQILRTQASNGYLNQNEAKQLALMIGSIPK